MVIRYWYIIYIYNHMYIYNYILYMYVFHVIPLLSSSSSSIIHYPPSPPHCLASFAGIIWDNPLLISLIFIDIMLSHYIPWEFCSFYTILPSNHNSPSWGLTKRNAWSQVIGWTSSPCETSWAPPRLVAQRPGARWKLAPKKRELYCLWYWYW